MTSGQARVHQRGCASERCCRRGDWREGPPTRVTCKHDPMAPTRDRVRQHRERLRQQGLRPTQIWVPDVNAPGSPARHTANRHSSPPPSRIETINPSWTRCRPSGTTTHSVRRGDIYTAAARSAYSGKPVRSWSSKMTGSTPQRRSPSCRSHKRAQSAAAANPSAAFCHDRFEANLAS
jgi:Protein  of unknown function (DUF3018)